MKYVVTAEEIQRYDQNTIQKTGIPGMVLMERAALAAFSVIEQIAEEKNLPGKSVLILAGMGNNGGDGLALARLLAEAGWQAEVWSVGEIQKSSGQRAEQAAILANYPVETGSKPKRTEYTILVDALFGVGLRREVTGIYREAIALFQALQGVKVAIDLPSGIDADTGKVLGIAVKADYTVAFGFLKRGLLLYPGCNYCGRVKDFSIGIGTRSFYGEIPGMFCYDEASLSLFPKRDPAGNKGTFGKVLFVAGSVNMAGAAVLGAKAAYRQGAGMVKVITPPENRVVLQSRVPEALLGTAEHLKESLFWADVIAIGPGLSVSEEARTCLKTVLEEGSLPLVLDADALNLLAEDEDLQKSVARQGGQGRKIILTPHVGELSRLTGKAVKDLKENLPEEGIALAKKLCVVVAAKDAKTIVCDGTGNAPEMKKAEALAKMPPLPELYVNTSGNSGMATAGSGDVLTGVIAALLAQGMSAFEAACAGVYLHGRAGDRAAAVLGEHGLMAGDIVEALAAADFQRKADADSAKIKYVVCKGE